MGAEHRHERASDAPAAHAGMEASATSEDDNCKGSIIIINVQPAVQPIRGTVVCGNRRKIFIATNGAARS
jgi:hypothetical protein